MRRSSATALPAPETGSRHDWDTLKTLVPYIWAYKVRVIFALSCLVAAKGANVTVPIIFKHLIDALSLTTKEAFIVVPAALLLAYGCCAFPPRCFYRAARIRLCTGHPAGGAAHLLCRCSAICMRCRCASISSARPAG